MTVWLLFLDLFSAAVAVSCFTPSADLATAFGSDYSGLLPGFAPVVSWQSLSYDTAYDSQDLLSSITNALPEGSVPSIFETDLKETPQSPEACQLACLLHPLCQSFVYLNSPHSKDPYSPGSLPGGCYLLKHFLSTQNLAKAPAAEALQGPRFCPGDEEHDWDGDNVPNRVDRCPLSGLQSNGSCPCFNPSAISTHLDVFCRWIPSSLDCIVPLWDASEGGTVGTLLEHVGSGVGSAGLFMVSQTPEKCRRLCRQNSACTFFTFDSVLGCSLFTTGSTPPKFSVVGEFKPGMASGPAFCSDMPPLSFSPALPDCRRYEVSLDGVSMSEDLLMPNYLSCSLVCKMTPMCQAWTFKFHDPRFNEGNCVLLSILLGEQQRKWTFSSPKTDCGSCWIDSDGDLVYDCHDYCPYDPQKTHPGFCGCGREGTPPLCRSTSYRRGLNDAKELTSFGNEEAAMSQTVPRRALSASSPVRPPDDVVATCYSRDVFYKADETILKALPGCAPLSGWIGPGGTPTNQPGSPSLGQDCHVECQLHPNCTSWSFSFASSNSISAGCYLYHQKDGASSKDVPFLNGSLYISGPKFCPGTCHDGLLNQDEDMIDCGGSTCPACGTLCHDGLLNQNEDDIDCGGVCPQCDCGRVNGGCDQLCVPFDDQPTCLCRPGYQRVDSKCQSIDRCKEGVPKPCVPFHCRNLGGNDFECSCPENWKWQPPAQNCRPPVLGPCFTENTLIDKAPLFDQLLSPISKLSGLTIPQSADQCYRACLKNDNCFVWIWVVSKLPVETQALKPGCHLRNLVKDVVSIPMANVTSGFKYGDPNDISCKSKEPHRKSASGLHHMNAAIPTSAVSNWKVLLLDSFDSLFFAGNNPVTGSQFLFYWELPKDIESEGVAFTLINATLEDQKTLLSPLEMSWQLPSSSMSEQQQTVKDDQYRLYRESFRGCSISDDKSKTNFCLLKADGLPANITLSFLMQLCSQKDFCGPEVKRSISIEPLPEPPVELQFSLTKDSQTERYNGKMAWMTDAKGKYVREATALSKSMGTLEVIARRSSDIWKDQDNNSPSLWLRVPSSSSETLGSNEQFAWDVLFPSTRNDVKGMLQSDTPNPPPTREPFLFATSFKCQDQLLEEEALMIQFPSPRCIHSIQLKWSGTLAPQLIAVQVLRPHQSQWTIVEPLGEFVHRRCNPDRRDSLDLLLMSSSSDTSSISPNSMVSKIRIYFGHPCDTVKPSLSNSICGSAHYSLQELILEECKDVIRRWILVGRQLQPERIGKKSAQVSSSRISVTDWTWDITTGVSPELLRSENLQFRIHIAPQMLAPWFSQIPKDPLWIKALPSAANRHSGQQLSNLLWPILIGSLAAVGLMVIGVYCLVKHLRTKRKAQTDILKEVAERVAAQASNREKATMSSQSKSSAAALVTAPTPSQSIAPAVVSPGGHFHSLLEAISKLLPTIREESYFEATDLTRTSNASFSSAAKSWRLWGAATPSRTPQHHEGTLSDQKQ